MTDREKGKLGVILGTIHNRFNEREPYVGAWDNQRIIVAQVIQEALAEPPAEELRSLGIKAQQTDKGIEIDVP